MQIEPLKMPDVPACMRLLRFSFPNALPWEVDGAISGFETSIKESIGDASGVRWFVVKDGGGTIRGTFRLLELNMNYLMKPQLVLGLALVSVDPTFRGQGVGRQISDLLDSEVESLKMFGSVLYPFSPGFYRKFGYGFASENRTVLTTPSNFRAEPLLETIMIDSSAWKAVRTFEIEYFKSRHGLIVPTSNNSFLDLGDANENFVAAMEDGEVKGVCQFAYSKPKSSNVLKYKMAIRRILSTTPESLESILAFISHQSSQVAQVEVNVSGDWLSPFLIDERTQDAALRSPLSQDVGILSRGLMFKPRDAEQTIQLLADFSEISELRDCKLKLCGPHEKVSRIPLKEKQISATTSGWSSFCVGFTDPETLSRRGELHAGSNEVLKLLSRAFACIPRPESHYAF